MGNLKGGNKRTNGCFWSLISLQMIACPVSLGLLLWVGRFINTNFFLCNCSCCRISSCDC